MAVPQSTNRVLTVPNLAFGSVAVVTFIIFTPFLDSRLGLFSVVLLASMLGVLAWWFASRIRSKSDDESLIKPIAVRLAVGVAGLLVLSVFLATFQILVSWNSRDRQSFSLEEAQSALRDPLPGPGDTTTTTAPGTPTTIYLPPLPDETYRTVLLIGGDDDSGNGDVILYLVLPTDGTSPFMMSFPRDLWVVNPCTGGEGRINVLAKGCPSKNINGGTLLAVKVSEMTGIAVDHFAQFTFEGFVDIIDAVGGLELCFEYAVRDDKSGLDLPAGCTDVGGDQALAWVRSRHTQEFRDGGWFTMPGAGDLMRNQHQQDVILQLFQKMKKYESPRQLSTVASELTQMFTLSDTISFSEAISLAWSARDIDLDSIQRLEIPVRLTRSDAGQSILVATKTPREVIESHYATELALEGSEQ